jgi:Phosphoesterase family
MSIPERSGETLCGLTRAFVPSLPLSLRCVQPTGGGHSLEELRPRPADARQQGLVSQRRAPRTAPASVVARLELRASEGRASAGRRVGRHGASAGTDYCCARVAALGAFGIPAHLRRARRLLRPRRAAAARCVRPSVRVPLWVVSPYSKKGPVKSELPAEHTSTLKLIEALHGLPTLSARNHLFDSSTPTGGNYETGGAPAPPRDGRDDISDLLDLFSF